MQAAATLAGLERTYSKLPRTGTGTAPVPPPHAAVTNRPVCKDVDAYAPQHPHTTAAARAVSCYQHCQPGAAPNTGGGPRQKQARLSALSLHGPIELPLPAADGHARNPHSRTTEGMPAAVAIHVQAGQCHQADVNAAVGHATGSPAHAGRRQAADEVADVVRQDAAGAVVDVQCDPALVPEEGNIMPEGSEGSLCILSTAGSPPRHGGADGHRALYHQLVHGVQVRLPSFFAVLYHWLTQTVF